MMMWTGDEDYVPKKGDVIEATIKFPRHEARRECRVTTVGKHGLSNGTVLMFVHGLYRTNRGDWSTVERVLKEPWTFLRSEP
jgi:hypothetical protein